MALELFRFSRPAAQKGRHLTIRPISVILMSSRASRFGAPSQQMLQVPMVRQDQTVRLDLVMETLICTAFAALNIA
ncbi:hypothetical protein B5K05_33885 [Rhizobium phaseoli]|nr:hypothetical protein B5K05_33885 [Rhizobium phaseoli]RDJ00918.1 hypothetical protein B5K04_31195 [Rhizobium phaseoli]